MRVYTVSNKFPGAWPAGFGLQVLDTTEGVLGLLPVLLSPAGRRRVLWLAGQLHIRLLWPQGQATDARTAHRADTDSDSGVPTSDDENVRGRHGSVKALQGPRRSTGSPHPRRSKKAPVSEVRRIAIG